jgi:hypothetical protein
MYIERTSPLWLKISVGNYRRRGRTSERVSSFWNLQIISNVRTSTNRACMNCIGWSHCVESWSHGRLVVKARNWWSKNVDYLISYLNWMEFSNPMVGSKLYVWIACRAAQLLSSSTRGNGQVSLLRNGGPCWRRAPPHNGKGSRLLLFSPFGKFEMSGILESSTTSSPQPL